MVGPSVRRSVGPSVGWEEVKLIQGTLGRLIPPHRPTDGPTVGPSVGRTVGGGEIHTESC